MLIIACILIVSIGTTSISYFHCSHISYNIVQTAAQNERLAQPSHISRVPHQFVLEPYVWSLTFRICSDILVLGVVLAGVITCTQPIRLHIAY